MLVLYIGMQVRGHHRRKIFLVSGSNIFKGILLCTIVIYLRNCRKFSVLYVADPCHVMTGAIGKVYLIMGLMCHITNFGSYPIGNMEPG